MENFIFCTVIFTLYNIAHIIRPVWKLIAVIYWNQRELVLGCDFTRLKTGAKSFLGEISPRVEHVTTYKGYT